MGLAEIDVGAFCAFVGGLGFLFSIFMHIISQSDMDLILATTPFLLFAIYYELKNKRGDWKWGSMIVYLNQY